MKTCCNCEFFNRMSFLHRCPAVNRPAFMNQCEPMIRYHEEKEMKNKLLTALGQITKAIGPYTPPEVILEVCREIHPKLEKLIEEVRNQ